MANDLEGRWQPRHRTQIATTCARGTRVLLGEYDLRFHPRTNAQTDPTSYLLRSHQGGWRRRALDGFLIAFAVALSGLFYGWLWELA